MFWTYLQTDLLYRTLPIMRKYGTDIKARDQKDPHRSEAEQHNLNDAVDVSRSQFKDCALRVEEAYKTVLVAEGRLMMLKRAAKSTIGSSTRKFFDRFPALDFRSSTIEIGIKGLTPDGGHFQQLFVPMDDEEEKHHAILAQHKSYGAVRMINPPVLGHMSKVAMAMYNKFIVPDDWKPYENFMLQRLCMWNDEDGSRIEYNLNEQALIQGSGGGCLLHANYDEYCHNGDEERWMINDCLKAEDDLHKNGLGCCFVRLADTSLYPSLFPEGWFAGVYMDDIDTKAWRNQVYHGKRWIIFRRLREDYAMLPEVQQLMKEDCLAVANKHHLKMKHKKLHKCQHL